MYNCNCGLLGLIFGCGGNGGCGRSRGCNECWFNWCNGWSGGNGYAVFSDCDCVCNGRGRNVGCGCNRCNACS